MKPAHAVLCLALLASCHRGPAEVRVGSKKFTESVVVGELVTQLVRSTGTAATHRAQLGSTQVLWHALLAGEVDVYPEYTGTLRSDIFKGAALGPGDDGLRAALEKSGVRMSASLGFEDTYALGMRDDEAQRLGISSLADLSAHPELRLGLSEEFSNRRDGWPAVVERYGLQGFPAPRTIDHDVAYRALSTGALDVTDLYSTDAEIPYYHLRVLRDERHAFPEYRAVLLYRADLPERFPAAAEALRSLEGQLSEADMRQLNARAKLERVPEALVAADFLRSHMSVASSVRPESRWTVLARALVEHLELVGISLAAAILVAVPLGILAARRRRLGAVVLGVAGVVQTVPSLALLVFMVPLLGIGTAPAVAALFLYSVLPIVRNMASGLTGVPVSLVESAEVLGLSSWARLWRIELPIASPSLLAGIQTSAIINVGTATLGAIIGAGGLGQPILTGIRLDDVGLILEGAVPAALLALVIQAVFSGLGRLLIPKGLRLARDT